jgi:hypothetical protein
MSYETILLKAEGAIATITLRPDLRPASSPRAVTRGSLRADLPARGLMRNTPDAGQFIELAESEGVSAAVTKRDGPFGDYSQADADDRPDPDNVIVP